MELMEAFAEHIRRFRSVKDVEIEMRLGRINNGFFDTNIGEPLFKKLVQALEKYTGWEKVTTTEDEVFYWDNGIRCIYDHVGNSTFQKKTNILKKDMKLDKSDVRLSISTEVKIPPVEDAQRSVTRKRKSFIRKNVRIDCTQVIGEPDDKDCEDSIKYQVELEFLDVSTDQLIFSALHKVKDIIKCV